MIPQLAALLKALGLVYYADTCDLSLRGLPGEGLWRRLHSYSACDTSLSTEGAQVNAGWVRWPTCTFSLGSQGWHVQSKLVSEANHASELWV